MKMVPSTQRWVGLAWPQTRATTPLPGSLLMIRLPCLSCLPVLPTTMLLLMIMVMAMMEVVMRNGKRILQIAVVMRAFGLIRSGHCPRPGRHCSEDWTNWMRHHLPLPRLKLPHLASAMLALRTMRTLTTMMLGNFRTPKPSSHPPADVA